MPITRQNSLRLTQSLSLATLKEENAGKATEIAAIVLQLWGLSQRHVQGSSCDSSTMVTEEGDAAMNAVAVLLQEL